MTTLVPPPDVYARAAWRVSGGGEITSLGTPAPAGTLLPILFEDNATGRGLVAGSSLQIEGDFRYTAGSRIVLWSIGTAWVEITRSSPATSKAFLSPYGAGTVGMHPGSANPGVLSTQEMLQTWVENRVYAPVITITLAADPSTVAATIEIDTSAENGDTETFSVTASQDPTTEAADIVKQMTGQSPYTTTPDLVTARNVSTFFKVTSSGGTITLKPKMSYAAMRNVTMRIVSGSGIASWTNLDGSAVSTSSVAVARMPMGGRVPVPAGLINGQEGADSPLVLDVPGTVLVGQPGTLWELSENGGVIVEADDCGVFGMNMVWPEEGSQGRNGKAAILVAASSFTARGNRITVDSLGTKGSGLSCSAMASIQIPAVYPTHRSYSYRSHRLLHNELHLGNRVAPITWNSVYDLNVEGNLITSLYSRTNHFGDGALSATEAPLPSRLTNCDEASWLNNRIMNIGGHSDADDSEAALVVERTSNGVDGTHEGGHITIQGGTIHGTANNYAAQIKLKNLWFARVYDVEMHRHLIPTHAETVNGGATSLTLSGGAPWSQGSTLTMTASAAQFDSATEVGNVYLLDDGGGNTVYVRVTAYTSDTVVTVLTLGAVPAGLQSTATTTWTRLVPYASAAYQDCAGLLVQDCIEVAVNGCEGFNFGSDGGSYRNYPMIGVVSEGDPLSNTASSVRKQLRVSNCNYQVPVASSLSAAGEVATSGYHPFLTYYNTENGHRYDAVDVTDNTLLAGGYASARFTVLDNANLAAGEGLTFVIPNSITGSGDDTINCREGTEFVKADAAGGEHATAQLIAGALNSDSGFATYFRAMVAETPYAAIDVPGAGATVLIEALYPGTAYNAATIEHLSSVSSTTSCTVGNSSPTTVAESATDSLEGGFGAETLTSQTAIALIDPFNATTLPIGPKHANVTGNTFRGFGTDVSGVGSVTTLKYEGNTPSVNTPSLASATNLVPTGNQSGSVIRLTGTTTVNRIRRANNGYRLTFVCPSGVTFNDGTASSGINHTMLITGGNATVAAGESIEFVYFEGAWHSRGA